MIIDEVAPTLTCVAAKDGFQYELLLRADTDKDAITKVRIGPYFFKKEFQPTNSIISLRSEGPDSGFWMSFGLTRLPPKGWGFWRWRQDLSIPENPWYLVATGVLSPGQQAKLAFVSMYAPGGIRAGMEIFRGSDHNDYGVTGPNFEHFLEGDHH